MFINGESKSGSSWRMAAASAARVRGMFACGATA
jgi:hypothetical protein